MKNQTAANPAIMQLSPKAQHLVENMGRALVGQVRACKLAVVAVLAGGHCILEDVPGTGKTLLSKSLARSIQANFKRIQATPDLLPSDISGVSIFDQRESTFHFMPGPIFTNILLMDEINRATPRTQSSLLEAMEEKQVTTDGTTRPLPELFFVIATQNPIEHHGTFPLPEAQLDRFMISMSLGYPDAQQEMEIVRKTLQEGAFVVEPVLTTKDIQEMQHAIRAIFVHDKIVEYIVNIVTATRNHPSVVLGVSPRGSQLLVKASQAMAFVEGREYVTPEDVKALAPYVFGHRVVPKVKSSRICHTDIIKKVLEHVPVPA
ncbi:MoxR family ATPase [Candidatus Obscuribacterales bacterium]|nr:MoxR family ATPase [Candidatus Obscuribacterales bacterium]MBX3153869.1 MoxR family ATPase [Candidatus Obscuribacterales bacterium]